MSRGNGSSNSAMVTKVCGVVFICSDILVPVIDIMKTSPCELLSRLYYSNGSKFLS